MAKIQKGDMVVAQIVRFKAEEMALQFAYKDCIKWIVVHPTKSEGYTLWWNGGTIQEMIRVEVLYNCESVHITLQAATPKI